MFERFGEFDSAEELNLTAEGLKTEGDMESLLVLAEENGIKSREQRLGVKWCTRGLEGCHC